MVKTLSTQFLSWASLGWYTPFGALWIAKKEVGTERMARIADAIATGAMAFLKAEYRVLAIFVVAVAALLAFTANSEESSPLVGLSFILGAFLISSSQAILECA